MVSRVYTHKLFLNILQFRTASSVKSGPVYRLILVKHSPVSKTQAPFVPVPRQLCDCDLLAIDVFAVMMQMVCKRAMTMKVNSWLTLPATPEIVFNTELNNVWELSLNELGIKPNQISSNFGNA